MNQSAFKHSFSEYARKRGWPLIRVLREFRLGRLPKSVGKPHTGGKPTSIEAYARSQGIGKTTARRLWEERMLPKEVVRKQDLRFLRPHTASGRRESRHNAGALAVTIYALAKINKKLKLIEHDAKVVRARLQKEQKRSRQEFRQVRLKLWGVGQRLWHQKRELQKRRALVVRLKGEADAGRLVDNAKTVEQIVRRWLGEEVFEWVQKRRAADERHNLAAKIRRAGQKNNGAGDMPELRRGDDANADGVRSLRMGADSGDDGAAGNGISETRDAGVCPREPHVDEL